MSCDAEISKNYHSAATHPSVTAMSVVAVSDAQSQASFGERVPSGLPSELPRPGR
jgi:hypothetical protein